MKILSVWELIWTQLAEKTIQAKIKKYPSTYHTIKYNNHQKNTKKKASRKVLAGAWAKTIPHNSQKVLYRNSDNEWMQQYQCLLIKISLSWYFTNHGREAVVHYDESLNIIWIIWTKSDFLPT